MEESEMARVQRYLQDKFGNDSIKLKERPQSDGSVEVYLDEEFIGIIYKDNEDGTKARVPNGDGTLYHNTLSQSVKYSGEFEDGKFDGAGAFYSKDGNLKITANNISNGTNLFFT